MTKLDADRIVAETQKVEAATKEVLDSFMPWFSSNVKLHHARELGGQIIVLSQLVADLAREVERLSGTGS